MPLAVASTRAGGEVGEGCKRWRGAGARCWGRGGVQETEGCGGKVLGEGRGARDGGVRGQGVGGGQGCKRRRGEGARCWGRAGVQETEGCGGKVLGEGRGARDGGVRGQGVGGREGPHGRKRECAFRTQDGPQDYGGHKYKLLYFTLPSHYTYSIP